MQGPVKLTPRPKDPGTFVPRLVAHDVGAYSTLFLFLGPSNEVACLQGKAGDDGRYFCLGASDRGIERGWMRS